MSDCPFCCLPEERVIARRPDCLAIYDQFPVACGHVLILPVRHVVSYTEASDREWISTLRLVQELKERLRAEDPTIAAFTLGVNDGAAAGQTVFHAHLHLIPRRPGDVPEPEGGVRWIFPGKANYLHPGPKSGSKY